MWWAFFLVCLCGGCGWGVVWGMGEGGLCGRVGGGRVGDDVVGEGVVRFEEGVIEDLWFVDCYGGLERWEEG
ncbi:hypothetical protein ACTHT6_11580 [Neisseria sp. P0022.S006]